METIQIHGTQIELKDKNSVQHRRNASHVKLYQEDLNAAEEILSDHKTEEETTLQEDNTKIVQPETWQNTADKNSQQRSARKRNSLDYFKS